MAVSDASSTRYENSQRGREADEARQALIDEEVADLQRLLDRMDGMTHDARQRLRRIERHRSGVAPEWTARRH